MGGEDNAVPIIGSDSERRENGETRMGEEEHRSELEEKVKSGEEEEEEEEGIKSIDEGEGMDGGGWAWVVVLGELICRQVPQPNIPNVNKGI